MPVGWAKARQSRPSHNLGRVRARHAHALGPCSRSLPARGHGATQELSLRQHCGLAPLPTLRLATFESALGRKSPSNFRAQRCRLLRPSRSIRSTAARFRSALTQRRSSPKVAFITSRPRRTSGPSPRVPINISRGCSPISAIESRDRCGARLLIRSLRWRPRSAAAGCRRCRRRCPLW